ncbi:MAG: ABC transporter ATP-binding protein [Halobacteriaceae archaeon]
MADTLTATADPDRVPAIQATDLTKRFGTVTALDGLSVTIDEGELFGLLGPNGAGKSTTINILTGQLVPDAGTASVLGIDPVAHPVAVREAVGILPEGARPPSFLTPREYMAFIADVRGLDDPEDRLATWADRLDFEHVVDTYCADLSQGERQKVMLAAAFCHEPDLVFIDEPLTNLDPMMQEEIKSFLAGYRDSGNAIVLSTHFVETAADLCTRVGFVADGRLVETVGPETIEASLLDRFIATVEQR